MGFGLNKLGICIVMEPLALEMLPYRSSSDVNSEDPVSTQGRCAIDLAATEGRKYKAIGPM
jgi:hypothetical protein